MTRSPPRPRSTSQSDKRRDNERKLMENMAELQVLEETLSKSLQLSSQMVDLLNSFDDRLKGFEKSILPIHQSTQHLNRYSENVEKTLVQANRIIEYYDLADVERAKISNGPDESNLLPYLESLDKITDALAYLTESKFASGEKAIYKLRQQQNAGVLQLVSLYKKWLTSISVPVEISTLMRDQAVPSPPAPDLKRLSELASRLANTSRATTPHESTDVADPTPVYVQVRSGYLVKTLSPLSSPNDARPRVEAKASSSFILFTTWLVQFLRAEQVVIASLFPAHRRSDVLDCVSEPAITTYLASGANLLNQIKRNNGRSDLAMVFVLFDVLEFWNKRRDEFGAVFSGLASKTSEKIESMFDTWTMTSLRVIPDFLEEIKQAPKGNPPPDGTVYELTSNAISFMKRLLEYPDSTESILLSIGEADWALTNVTNVRVKYVQSSGTLTRKYLLQALALLESTLESKSRTYRKPALAVIFQANNTHYILKNIRAGKLNSVLGPDVVAKYEKNLKRYRDGFTDQFKPLNELLMDVTVVQNNSIRKDMSSNERNGVKDKFAKYNTVFDDTIKGFRGCAVVDQELRAFLVKDAKGYLLPMYDRFMAKYQTTDFSRHKERYIKYDANQVSQIIDKMFLPS